MPKKEDKDGVVNTSKFDNSKKIRVIYEDENHFNKLSKSLKMYNMLAYKEFIFNLMYKLKDGQVVGYEIDDGIYRCDLESSKLFEFVYGKVYFTYRIEDDYKAVLLTMEPEQFLLTGHQMQLQTYRGVPIIGSKDRFKVDMYFLMEQRKNK